MRITRLETFVVDRGSDVCFVFVRLSTDAGLMGVGEATLEWQEKSVVAAVEELGAYLIGEDPFRIELLWERMYRNCAWPGVVRFTAMSGVEHALWDIVGQAVGQPVYNLLGGKVRERIKCYAWPSGADPQSIADSARALVAKGFRALKMDPFEGFMTFTPQELGKSVKMVAAVREAIGWDVDLAVDGHWRLLPMTAIAFAREIEPLKIMFFEEPCPSDNLDTLSELHEKINIPLAVGERYYTKWGFRPLLERQVVSIIQPDLCHVGGILECKKVAAMAEAYHVVVVPHNPNGPISSAVCVQLGACTPNFMMMESSHVDPWRDELVSPPVQITGGYLQVPDRPGLGVELNEQACRLHASQQRSFFWFKEFPW